MVDKTMAEFFQKYGGQRARPVPKGSKDEALSSMTDSFLLELRDDYRNIVATQRTKDGELINIKSVDNIRNNLLPRLETEARKRNL